MLFFFNATASSEIYTLSLHDALPICDHRFSSSDYDWVPQNCEICLQAPDQFLGLRGGAFHRMRLGVTCKIWRCTDRKSTRLNSSHPSISYAVFCLKKKKDTSLIYRDL